MNLLAWTLAFALLGPATPAPKSQLRLAELVAQIRSADYRGDRAALARLEGELSRLDAGSLTDYREYWRGFALWRRVLNGFNETPMPGDLSADLEKAIARFRASIETHPDWIEAKLAMVGCWGNLIYLAGDDADKRKAIFAESGPTFKWVMANVGDNPRALWIRGGMEFAAPPPIGGDLAKAAATLRYGVACAWRETLANPGAPPWVPSWGGPENLMNLAYLQSHGDKPDRSAALAYAEGAVTAAPEWHYVRDILLPQIEALPVTAPAP
ncbi:MAG: hypothetical protein ABI968_08145 [Acidobacteriota bacterium]